MDPADVPPSGSYNIFCETSMAVSCAICRFTFQAKRMSPTAPHRFFFSRAWMTHASARRTAFCSSQRSARKMFRWMLTSSLMESMVPVLRKEFLVKKTGQRCIAAGWKPRIFFSGKS